MNSIERVENRLSGKPVDKVPNLNIIMQFTARYINVPYGKYCTDYRYLVEGNMKCCQDFEIDMVSAISDPYRETSGLGGNVSILEDDVPRCTDYYIKEYRDVKKLKPIDPAQSERILEQSILFARQQIKEGAQYIGIGDAAASLVSPKFYKELILPAEKRLIDEIHRNGARAKLHICGNTTALLNLMAESGADIIDIDHMVDLTAAFEKIGEKALLCGNFDPVSILLDGDVDMVKKTESM